MSYTVREQGLVWMQSNVRKLTLEAKFAIIKEYIVKIDRRYL